jgi:RNA 3'-terminal phosphate cyclase (ATP)
VLIIDGSSGEGGGQILRSSLSLSLITQRPIRIINIRAKRSKPGLQQQHLTAVRAAAEIGRAKLDGATLGSREIVFEPKRVEAGDYHFAIGTAGSTSLVFQTVLYPLLLAPGRTRVTFEGGTHNPMCPPFEFLAKAFVPLLRRMGASIELELERYGFYPAGGGKLRAELDGGRRLSRLDLLERGEIRAERATAMVSRLPLTIAQRELAVAGARLGWTSREWQMITTSPGPGNVLVLEVEHEHGAEVFTGFGEKGKPAEQVAEEAVAEHDTWRALEVPVGVHLADQLLLPMALAGGGSYRTGPLSLHATTNIEVLRKFLPVIKIDAEAELSGTVRVRVG